MLYFEKVPSETLRKYIDKFWYCQAEDLTNSTLTIPLLHHELVFNFSDFYCISRLTRSDQDLINLKSWVSGIQTRPIISKSIGKHEMMGVLFKPNGLKAFTKYHSSDFENSFIEATLIFDNFIDDLMGQIQNAEIVESKFSIIEAYLIQNLKPNNSPQYLDITLDIFEFEKNEYFSIKKTCNQVTVSNKSLINAYKKHIGITPKKYVHLLSINKALLHLTKFPKQSLTQLAYDLNFYDQAHFINLFKATTSLTPSEYSSYVLKNKTDKESPNFIYL